MVRKGAARKVEEVARWGEVCSTGGLGAWPACSWGVGGWYDGTTVWTQKSQFRLLLGESKQKKTDLVRYIAGGLYALKGDS